MFLNIITPCNRPENLNTISESINIPREKYRWIVVFDSNEFPSENLIPNNCESYIHKDLKSGVGNSQRNFALNLVNSGHIYFNDDDTVIHKDLWDSIENLDGDFISFKQIWKNGRLRLDGNNITAGNIDSHNFIISYSLLGDSRWKVNRYDADGVFAEECYKKAKNPIYIPKILSIYNSLR